MLSMTGFGLGQASSELGSVVIELRSVNSRYLDIQLRLPEELRLAEMPLREKITQRLSRGKIELRANYTRAKTDRTAQYPSAWLKQVHETHAYFKQVIPDLAGLTVSDLLHWPEGFRAETDLARWVPSCLGALDDALEQMQETRAREGHRLANMMMLQAHAVQAVLDGLRPRLTDILQSHRDRMAARLREALEQACPQGLQQITGQELSERLATEVSLIALKSDVAEELDRLTAHLQELGSILASAEGTDRPKGHGKGHGKRLDFLFQEMNREANTLGSKAVHLEMTRAAMDLKMLIEQMREQIQNIE